MSEIYAGGTVEMIELATTKIDDSYQRSLRMGQIEEMYNDWSDEACGLLIVSEREDGTRWYVDGQHRAHAAMMLEKTHLPAIVLKGLSLEQEAELRLLADKRRKISPSDRFRAELVAKRPRALSILKICRDFKALLAIDQFDRGRIGAIATIEKIWDIDEGVTLRHLFRIISETWGKLNYDTTNSTILHGIRWALETHASEIDEDHLKATLKTRRTGLLTKGRLLQAELGGTPFINFYRAVIEEYNKKLPKGQQLTTITRGYKGVKEREN